MESKHHIVIPEPQDRPAVLTQVLITSRVVLSAGRVTCTIELHGNPHGCTAKIEEVRPHGMLTAELETLQPPGSQPAPECFLGWGFVSSQLSRPWRRLLLPPHAQGQEQALCLPLSPTLSPFGREGDVDQLQREFEQLSVVLQNRPRQHNCVAAPHASHCVLFPHTAPAPQYRPPEASQHR